MQMDKACQRIPGALLRAMDLSTIPGSRSVARRMLQKRYRLKQASWHKRKTLGGPFIELGPIANVPIGTYCTCIDTVYWLRGQSRVAGEFCISTVAGDWGRLIA